MNSFNPEIAFNSFDSEIVFNSFNAEMVLKSVGFMKLYLTVLTPEWS